MVVREFATRPEVSGLFGELKELLSQLAGLISKNPSFTDNASVSLQPVRRAGAGGGPLLMAMSETPPASYIINPADLTTMEQVRPACRPVGLYVCECIHMCLIYQRFTRACAAGCCSCA